MPGTELTEAILSASGASALIQKEIDPTVQELQRRYAPLVKTLPSVRWGSNIYNFNQRSQVAAGGFVTDGGARPISSSTYNQYPFQIRNLQAVGGVTGYAEAVTADLIGSLRAKEIEGAGRGLMWDIEMGILWGCAGATVDGPYPEFDGLDQLVSDYSSGAPNALNWANAAFSTALLDQLIELVEANAAEYPGSQSEYSFVVSSAVDSYLAQLLTNQQRFNSQTGGNLGTVEISAGLIVPTYRNIPIIKSSFLNPRNTAFGTVTAANSDGGGTALVASTEYFYQVSAIIARFGETLASAECNATTTADADTDDIITLSFTPPTVTTLGQTLSALLYKVYRSTTTNLETLLGVVDANVGLQSDNVTPIPTTSIVDTGATLVPQNGETVPASFPAAYVGTNAHATPPKANQHNLYLLPRDPDLIIRPYVREMQTVNIYPTTASPDSLPFAFVADTCLAVRAPQFLARAANVLVNPSLI
jgi:hypothetical protein